ncbi:MAG: hypothetical protein R3F60_22190 [bacterium]
MTRLARRLLVLLALAPAAGMAQTPDTLRAEVRARAAAEGVPVGPLDRKITEGLAKGVPPALIATAVARLHDRLRAGAGLCGGWARQEDCTVAAADALQVGLPAEAVGELLGREGAEGDRLEALFAISDLHTRGVPADAALALVTRAQGRGPADATALVKAILAEADRTGQPAADVARAALAAEGGQPPVREGGFHANQGRGKAVGRPDEHPGRGQGTPPGQDKKPK